RLKAARPRSRHRMLWKAAAGICTVALVLQTGLARAQNTPPELLAKKVGAGWVFTDVKGMTLYTYAQDKPGQSKCVGAGAATWPPLVATSVSEATGRSDWSLVDRDDGKKQIAFRGMPLYRYAKDPAPGTTFGEGVSVAWSVARKDMETPPGIA